MKKVLALRFDVDSITCACRGIPNLLELGQRYDIPMTFFVTMGRAIERRRLFKKKGNDSKSMHKIGPLKKMGLMDTMRTLIWNPNIGITYSEIFLKVLKMGHELGLHGGRNHGWWQSKARHAGREQLEEDLSWGYNQFAKYFSEPEGFTAPGFIWNRNLLEWIEKKAFKYAGDMDGVEPFQPVINKRKYTHWQIPVTIFGPGKTPYIEWACASGKNDKELISGFLEFLGKHPCEVLYGHPFWEGLHGIRHLEDIICCALDHGYTFKRLKDLILFYPVPKKQENHI